MLSFLLLVGCFFGNVNDQLDQLDEELSELSRTVEDQAVLIEELEAENAALLSELESLQEGGGSTAAPSLEYTLTSTPLGTGTYHHDYDYEAAFSIVGEVDDHRIIEYASTYNSYPDRVVTIDHENAQCEVFAWGGRDELPYRSFVVEAWRGASYWCWEVDAYAVLQTDCASPTRVEQLTCD